MRTVELIPGIRSSVLGFGCAPILGAVSGDTARRAVSTALEQGVTHFDIAPSYGYGEAEAWLGRALAGRRDEVILATKFGIVATSTARLLRPLKPLVRLARQFRGHGTSAVGAAPAASPSKVGGDRFHARLTMTAAGLRTSVETSLRRLRTDRLDWLFLHEPREALGEIETLAEVATALKREGKLRAWGLAYMRDTESVHSPVLGHFDALQFDLSPGLPGYEDVRARRASLPNIFFSPFRGISPEVTRAEVLRRLTTDFPRSVVLCSMFNPDHIRANVSALA
jgi:aryl-alcohol dehydrogenase-like predicted oxidoreductase